MPCPPKPQSEQASGSNFLHLLDALAKEYERLQHENAGLVAAMASRASSSPHREAVQDPPDSPETMTKQLSPTSELSNKSTDRPVVDQQMSSECELSPEQRLPVNSELSVDRRNRKSRAALAMPYEMSSQWKEHPELMHQPVSTIEQTSFRSMTELLAKRQRFDQHYKSYLAIHPDSHRRHFWILGCAFLLMLDSVWVPFDIGFDMHATSVSRAIHYISLVYWTLDIPMSFLTGVVFVTHIEMRLKHIAANYAKTWLCFDLLMLLPDYMELAADRLALNHISVLRVLRWGRFMRLLRVARLSKVEKVKPVLRTVAARYHLSRVYVEVTRGLLNVLCVVLFWMHAQSCLWHGFGKLFQDGWIQANNLGSANIGRRYTVSFHWSFDRLIGMHSNYELKTVPELAVDTLLLFSNLLTFAHLLGFVTMMVITRIQSKPFSLWKTSVAYSIRHDLSHDLDMRLAKWVGVSDFGNVGDLAEEENNLLSAVPDSMRQDLLFETWFPFMAHKQVFQDMARIKERTARHVCSEALKDAVLVPHEVVFQHGDAGHVMRFVYHGIFAYSYPDSENEYECVNLESGGSISEAVLWTQWEHTGRLTAMQEPRILTLDPHLFALTVKNHKGSLVHAVRYAKLFVQKLNGSAPVNDLTEFEFINLAFLNENMMDASHEKHFIFISHYKVEAGTEATLMFDLLNNLLTKDPGHVANHFLRPIFIDSEKLTDLVRLKAHVKRSAVLLLLLPPGVLSRPWCLIEIATAIKYSVGIVLVDIQRPGNNFEYPDDMFYARLLAGKTLDHPGVDLLKSHGITLESLEKGLRRIFCKISLPFSPHRSEEVREAELHDILKRCHFESSQKVKSTGKE